MRFDFRHLLFALILLVASAVSAYAVDEIQVYNAEIAKVGQWTMQLHLNNAFIGRKEPDFPGGLIPNHALNGTPEWAYGITDWWEMGFYAPFAVDQNGTFYSNAVKIRQLFVTPNAAEREIFYGVNFEFSYAMPQFSDTRWNVEIRPIIGVRKGDYEFIVNPIVDFGFGQNGDLIRPLCAQARRKPLSGGRILFRSRSVSEFRDVQRAATQHLCSGRLQDRPLRRECGGRIRPDARIGPPDGQNDHWYGSQRGPAERLDRDQVAAESRHRSRRLAPSLASSPQPPGSMAPAAPRCRTGF
jgi:hypothetical protein